MTSQKVRVALSAATLVCVGALAGCDGSDESTKAASATPAVSAIAKTFQTDKLTATITMDVSDNVISSMFDKQSERDLAKDLLQSTVTVASRTNDGSKLADQAGVVTDMSAAALTRSDTSLSMSAGGENLLDLRVVGGSMFVAAGVEKFADMAGEDTTQMRSSLQRIAPELMTLLDGGFVSLSKGSMTKLMEQATAAADGADTKEDAELVALLTAPAKNVLAKSSKSTKVDEDTFRVKVDVKELVGQYSAALSKPETVAQIAKLTGEDPASIKKDIAGFKTDLPKDVKDLTFDVTIKDGKATELDINLLQFASWSDRTKAKFSGGHAHMRVAFAQKADITAPKDATSLDDLMNRLMSQSM